MKLSHLRATFYLPFAVSGSLLWTGFALASSDTQRQPTSPSHSVSSHAHAQHKAVHKPRLAQHRSKQRTPIMGPAYGQNPQVMLSADTLAQELSLPATWVREAIGQARFSPQVIRLMSPAPQGFQKNWRVYRSRFIEPIRLQAGVRFWNENEATLMRAEQTYGVPAAIVVGILGVETLYGKDIGTFDVIDSLCTLAFDFPKQHPKSQERQAYFRSELGQFLKLSHRSGMSPRSFKGSYAGAMGWPQFMPGSWAQYAVDFDGDGKIDLYHSLSDVIGSVAHYFQQHGWQTGLSTHFEARFAPGQSTEQRQQLLTPDILPSFTPDQAQALGMDLDAATRSHPGKLALVELQNGSDEPQYFLGTQNFYVITRYNWSAYYASAVIELAAQVQNMRLGESR